MRTKFFLQKKPNRKRNGLHEWQIRAFCTNGVFLQEIPITNVNINVTIGNGVTTIGGSAFSGCSSLTSVTIPDSVNTIGEWAFSHCSSLTSVVIPDSVTSIGEGAFNNCSKLTSVTIPNSVTSIGRNAFYHCSRLGTVTIGSGVTKIDKFAFWACAAFSQYNSSVTFKDTSTWYRTSSSDYTGGTVVDVTDTHKNANNLSDSNNDSYYWYKTEQFLVF